MTGSRKSKSGSRGSFTTVSGHNIFTGTSVVTGSNQFSVGLHPRQMQSNRLTSYADIFEGYRIDKLAVHFCLGGSGSNIGVAYLPTRSLDVSALNFQSITETDRFAMSYPGLTTPRVLRIGKADLHGEFDWYDTTNTGEAPGILQLSILSSATNLAVAQVFLLYFEWTMTFYGPENPSLTMARMRERVRQQILDEEFDGESSCSSSATQPNRVIVRKKILGR